MDNLDIKGIRDDEPRNPGRRMKLSRGRKTFVLQSRYVHNPKHHAADLWFLLEAAEQWYTHSRYHTESALDQAYTAMVKKDKNDPLRIWGRQEFRKI